MNFNIFSLNSNAPTSPFVEKVRTLLTDENAADLFAFKKYDWSNGDCKGEYLTEDGIFGQKVDKTGWVSFPSDMIEFSMVGNPVIYSQNILGGWEMKSYPNLPYFAPINEDTIFSGAVSNDQYHFYKVRQVVNLTLKALDGEAIVVEAAISSQNGSVAAVDAFSQYALPSTSTEDPSAIPFAYFMCQHK
jgi:hypothetical protein